MTGRTPPSPDLDLEAGISSSPPVTPGSESNEQEVEDKILLMDHAHAMDMAGAPDELLDLWAEEEASRLRWRPEPLEEHGQAGDTDLRGPVPPRARELCVLAVLGHVMNDLDLHADYSFEAAALLDAYLDSSRGCVAKLPMVSAVLLRMVWKEACSCSSQREGRPPKLAAFASQLSGHLAKEGFPEAEEGLADLSEDAFLRTELAILSALQWKVNTPSLAKWTQAFFRRLEHSVKVPRTKTQVAAALDRCMWQEVRWLTVFIAPSPQFQPQRLARGLFLLHAARDDLVPAELQPPEAQPRRRPLESMPEETYDYLLRFERIVGAAPDELLEDCQLAERALQMMGVPSPASAGQLAAPLAAVLNRELVGQEA